MNSTNTEKTDPNVRDHDATQPVDESHHELSSSESHDSESRRSASHSSLISERRTMRAIAYEKYGGPEVLHAAKVKIPRRLPGQVLIQVFAAGINPIDYRLRSGEARFLLPFGFPRIPGYDVAGVIVDASGDNDFQVGDRVMAFLNHLTGGGYAELASCALSCVAKIPDSMSLETAAAIPLAGTTALQSLRDHGKIRSGDRVLINGASGGVGTFAIQIAKAYGCHVDAVASGANREYCQSLGADSFINYEEKDFTQGDPRWNLVFDAAGKSSYRKCRRVLMPGGRYVSTEPSLAGAMMSLMTAPLSKKGRIMLAKAKADDLRELLQLHASGKLRVEIDRQFPMDQAADAHRRLETGVDHGKIVLSGWRDSSDPS